MMHRLLFYRPAAQVADFSDYIHEIAAGGVAHVTLAKVVGDVDLGDPAAIKTASAVLDEAGVRALGLHGPFAGKMDLNTVGAGAAHTALLPGAAELGIRTYVLHAGVRDDTQPTNRQWSDVRRNLDVLIPAAEEAGIILALENLPPAYLGSQENDLISLVESYAVPNLRLCYDSGHANMNGCPVEILRRMAPYVATMHLHDNDGTLDSHLSPGHGSISWEPLARVINDECRPLHVEIEAFNHEALSTQEIIALYTTILE